MDEELEVLRQYVESLGLDKKSGLEEQDRKSLVESLSEADEITLANYVSNLPNVSELEDLITNTLYG
jgi:hypothetical protein